MKRFIIEKSDDEFYASHSGLVLAGLCINCYARLSRAIGRAMKDSGKVIADADILRSYLGLLCLGKSDYQAITAMRDDDYFKSALGIEVDPIVKTDGYFSLTNAKITVGKFGKSS